MDIVYLKDSTGSMHYEINAAKDNPIDIFKQLTKNIKIIILAFVQYFIEIKFINH